MKETCYRVKMTGCRVKITGVGRVKKKVPKGGKKMNLEGEKRVSRVGKKGWRKNKKKLVQG